MSDIVNENQRVRLTKQLVREALMEMLKTQNINKISIRELCSRAGINRTTFYNHYGSQYDVLNEITKLHIDNASYVVIDSIAAKKPFDICLAQVLQYIKDNMVFFKLMFAQDNYDLMEHITVSLPQFSQMIINKLPGELEQDKKDAIALYVQCGTVKLIEEWIEKDCIKTPEEEAKLIIYVAGRVIGGN